MHDSKKNWDTADDTKLQGIVSNQGTFEKRLFQRAKYTGSCMNVRGNLITGTVLPEMESFNFNVIVTTLTPLTSKTNAMVTCKTFRPVTR